MTILSTIAWRRRARHAVTGRMGRWAPFALAAAGACTGERESVAVLQPRAALWNAGLAARSVDAPLDSRVLVGGSESDTSLSYPYQLLAWHGRIYVVDASQTVRAFDTTGAVLWTFGAKGRGPREFVNVRDIAGLPGGGVALLDAENGRITQLTAGGALDRTVPVPREVHAEQFAVLPGNRFLLFNDNPGPPLLVVDTAGRPAEATPFPWAGYAGLESLARQGVTAAASPGGRWAFGFAYGNGWFAYDGATPHGAAGRYVEHVRFPAVVTVGTKFRRTKRLARNIVSALSLTMDDSVVYVLFGGRGRTRGRLVDRFAWADGSYLGSVSLPERAIAIAKDGARLYALGLEPYPSITVLRVPRPAASGGNGIAPTN
jgi:hypothetical protein